ncbi:hypothetical protein [Pseudaestuariivita sp.]|uniref:hypothetical protein n=1 Tax=Pseudaestuariivita sp. TaxID=2211669 RepID=UPI0040599006
MFSVLPRALPKPLRGILSSRVATDQSPAAATPALSLGTLQPRLVIPTCERSREEKEQGWHHDQGLHLARQDEWDALSELITRADAMRATTAGATPVSLLMAQGARADLTAAASRAGRVHKTHVAGVAALDALAEERADDPATALVAALAHVDLGWAYRGEGWSSDLESRDHTASAAHFGRAAGLLDRFDPAALDAPSLAAARCAVLPGTDSAARQVIARYETVIGLEPGAPCHMRAFGNHLLPRWFGDYETLNLEARRTAAQTVETWGNGGYTWVYMDALLVDERAFEMLDTDFFLDGVRDILTQQPSQHLANLFAAYLGISCRGRVPRVGDKRRIERARARLTAGFRWVLSDHLRELHPLLWAEAAERFRQEEQLPDRAALVRAGRATAFRRIAEVYSHVMAEGQVVEFGPDGVNVAPAH